MRRCIQSFLVFQLVVRSDVRCGDEIVEAHVDLINEIDFALDNDNTEDTEPIDQKASIFEVMFEEL